jgi:hypothetical protein
MTTEKFEVLNRWTNAVQFTAEITVTPDMLPSVKLGRVVKWAKANGAYLSDAYLSDADLSGADLSGANLSDAPKIKNIHQKVYAAASAQGALDMADWHRCETTHCRAGWITILAGDEGKALEDRIGTRTAATLIYLASDPTMEKFPSFYCGNDEALADMKAMAEAEAARAA